MLVDDFSGIVNRNREVENTNRVDLGAKGKKVSPDAPENGPSTQSVIADEEFYKPTSFGTVEAKTQVQIKVVPTDVKSNARTNAFIED